MSWARLPGTPGSSMSKSTTDRNRPERKESGMKNQGKSNSGRREFLSRSGSVVSAVLAPAAAGIAGAGTGESLNTERGQRTLLEDAAEIRELYRDYAANIAA